MPNTEHTPGPWRVETWEYMTRGHVPVIVAASDAVAHVDNLWGPNERAAEQLANARLIAAAPDLLAALEACYTELDYLTKEYERTGKGFAEPWSALQSARAAIAKARGTVGG